MTSMMTTSELYPGLRFFATEIEAKLYCRLKSDHLELGAHVAG